MKDKTVISKILAEGDVGDLGEIPNPDLEQDNLSPEDIQRVIDGLEAVAQEMASVGADLPAVDQVDSMLDEIDPEGAPEVETPAEQDAEEQELASLDARLSELEAAILPGEDELIGEESDDEDPKNKEECDEESDSEDDEDDEDQDGPPFGDD